MTDKIAKLMQLTKDILYLCENSMPFKSNQYLTKEQCYALILYSTILELSSDSILMVGNGRSISSPILIRSLLEYYVETLYLIADSNRFMQRLLDADRERQKGLNKIAESTHCSFSDIKTDPKFEDLRRELSKILEGRKETGVQDIFNKLDMAIYYDTVYRPLSAYVHPNMKIAFNAIVASEYENDGLLYNPHYEFNENDAISFISLVKQILIDVIDKICQFIPNSNIFTGQEELKKICSLWDNYISPENPVGFNF